MKLLPACLSLGALGSHLLEMNAFSKKDTKISDTNLTFRNAGCGWSLLSSGFVGWMCGDAVSEWTSSRVLIVGLSVIGFIARIYPSYRMWTAGTAKDTQSSEVARFARYFIEGLDFLVQLLPQTPSYMRAIWK